jgi:hypothetical protein
VGEGQGDRGLLKQVFTVIKMVLGWISTNISIPHVGEDREKLGCLLSHWVGMSKGNCFEKMFAEHTSTV